MMLHCTGRPGGRYPLGKIFGMWYYPPQKFLNKLVTGEGSTTCQKSYPGGNALPISLCCQVLGQGITGAFENAPGMERAYTYNRIHEL
jgi:hypothetical protein